MNSSDNSSWIHTLNLPLIISRADLPTPPVLTPHICRRYSLVLWVKLKGPFSDKATLQLEVPVQIAYRSYADTNLPPPYASREDIELEEESVDVEAPFYCP
jgi:hypothetical protein